MYSYGLPHKAGKKQDDQHEHTFSSYVRIRDVALKTCQRRWTTGKSGKRGSGISVPEARHDDDDDVVLDSSFWLIHSSMLESPLLPSLNTHRLSFIFWIYGILHRHQPSVPLVNIYSVVNFSYVFNFRNGPEYITIGTAQVFNLYIA